MIWIGTSGWQYADWRGVFYPGGLPQARWLEWFSSQFATVEVNNTFYRLPGEATFDRWRAESAPGFLIAVKASRFITHIRRLREGAEPVELMWTRASRLKDKLGPVLFQLPPNFPRDDERLRALLGVLPGRMRPAFEFRDRSWDAPEVRRLLDDAGAALVLADRPGARVPDVVCGGWAYVRFHQGGHGPHGAAYATPKVRRWADRIAALDADDVFVYFNNDPGGAAVRDAVALRERLAGLRPGDVAGAELPTSVQRVDGTRALRTG